MYDCILGDSVDELNVFKNQINLKNDQTSIASKLYKTICSLKS